MDKNQQVEAALKLALLRKKEMLEFDKKLKIYQKDPMLWLEERWGEDRKNYKWSLNPGYGKHEWDGTPDPLYNAWMALVNQKFVGIESATGTGKTHCASRLVFWFLDVFPNSLVVTIGPTATQLRDSMWSEISLGFPKFKRLRPNAELLDLNLRVDGKNKGNRGWQAVSRSGMTGAKTGKDGGEQKSTKTQGFHRDNMLFVIDEMAGVYQGIINSIQHTITAENNLIIGLGNPDSETDALHKFMKGSNVESIRISGLDHPNVVCDDANIIPGAVTRHSIALKKETYGENSAFYRSRVRGICPTQQSNSLFDVKAFDECVAGRFPMDNSQPAAGVDVANSVLGDLACVVYGFKNVVTKVHAFQCPEADAIADNMVFTQAELDAYGIRNYRITPMHDYGIRSGNVGVDAVGVGVSTINRFNRLNMKVIPLHGSQDRDRIPVDDFGTPMYNFGSLRAQMYFELAEDIKNRKIMFGVKTRGWVEGIRKAMSYIYIVEKGGKTYITPKDEIRSFLSGDSPNELDALVYWNWVRKINAPDSPKKKDYVGVWDLG